ncbi:hypothetical protein Leryth_019044 [Lithospermum erythrorhizon]|nr:hypothetical protein Leryth_019044 [Lithospermum erythrorhizon]
MRFLLEKLILIILCYMQILAAAQKLKTYNTKYDSFNETHYTELDVQKPAMISNDALQITPDSASEDFDRKNKSGRIFLKTPFRLWDGHSSNKSTSKIASFTTSFLINIYRPKNETAAEGLAFVIASNTQLPPNSEGAYLGLTNAKTDGNISNKFIAIEIDTFKQSFDPDGNHVGIDINSVESVKTESLSKHGIDIAPIGPKFFNFWVQYNGSSKVLDIFVAEQEEKTGPTPPKPYSPILSHKNLDLKNIVNEYSYFGFSGSTGNYSQLNCVLRWNLTVDYLDKGQKEWLHIGLAIGVPIIVLFLGAIWLGYYLNKRRVLRSNSDILGKLKSLPGTPREFKFRELKKATNNFDEKHKLGQGGFGVVYRGKIASENREIAVKWFSRENLKGQDDFLAELTIINRLRHKHLVPLLGWCHRNMKLLLVYEYMPNGSLDHHLFRGPEVETLNWNFRHKIISGVASALQYLHNEYDQRVVHRDLKASNIMVDANFNARLGDFGLARALDNEKTSYAEAEGVLGTIGYIAPECFHTGRATRQSDVYAFGAVILEVVCGLRPGTKIGNFTYLADWVWFMHRDGHLLEAVDPRLKGDYDAEQAERLLLLGLACSHPIASERPRTQDIVQIIAGTVPTPIVPPFKPAFVWPSMMPLDIDSSAANTGSITTASLTTSHYNSGWSDQQYVNRENYTGNSMV